MLYPPLMRFFSRLTLAALFTFLSLTSAFAQQAFEAGYLIDRAGKRNEVNILNEDWRFNPAEILIRRGADEATVSVPTKALKEFGIYDRARYINLEVAIEKSSTSSSNLSATAPIARMERVLLRVEVEGDANLYSYLAPQVSKYFLSVDGGKPRQLIYTRTLVGGGTVSEARTYIRQLNTHLSCGQVPAIKETLKYSLKAIKQAVMDYNGCTSGGSSVVYENAIPGAKSFYVTVLPGAYYADFKLIQTSSNAAITDLQNRWSPRLGVDIEFVPPFAGNKMSVLFRPSLYRFSSSGPYFPSNGNTKVEVSYSALDLPFAVRYYSFLQEELKLFTTAGFGVTVPIDQAFQIEQSTYSLDGRVSLALDLGVRYRDRYSLSLGYEKDGDGLVGLEFAAKASGFRVMMGYTL